MIQKATISLQHTKKLKDWRSSSHFGILSANPLIGSDWPILFCVSYPGSQFVQCTILLRRGLSRFATFSLKQQRIVGPPSSPLYTRLRKNCTGTWRSLTAYIADKTYSGVRIPRGPRHTPSKSWPKLVPLYTRLSYPRNPENVRPHSSNSTKNVTPL